MKSISVYQIYYDEATKIQLQPDFLPLDNTKNLRPDWAEYWVIRQFFENNELNSKNWYGFFSPSFARKTELTDSQVIQFVQQQEADCEVILFSPYWANTSFFKNPFEQAEWEHQLLPTAIKFFKSIGSSVDLENYIAHRENTVYCNYFVAKPRFWMRWLEITNALFELAENPDSSMYAELNEDAQYQFGQYGKKVFIIERIATTILVHESFKTASYDTFALPSHNAGFDLHREQLIKCEALKRLYASTREDRHLMEFISARNLIWNLTASFQNRSAKRYSRW